MRHHANMIEISNLSKSYSTPQGRFEALQGINLHIKEGEIFGIIGPSGAGKSTLVKCINLLERADGGTITIAGQLLSNLSESALRAQRRRIGMVFQGFNLLARRTVYGNVALPLEISGVPAGEIRSRVMRLLELVGLTHLADRYPNQISGGQKQRVGIARALANDPDVLLSDEATSALDPETTQSILSLLRDINRQTGITVVLITHQMEVVRQICHQVAVLEAGKIVEQGATLEVFSNPQHAITRSMVSAVTASDLTEQTMAALKARIVKMQHLQPSEPIVLWRLQLSGGDAGSLISILSRTHGLEVVLIQARVEDIQGVAVGTLFVLAQAAASSIAVAFEDIHSHHATIEEILHESAIA
jgi:D-methionine transport system ATP-binding protein